MAAELDAMSDGLFPPSAVERLDKVAEFIRRELGHRASMLIRHQEKRSYWKSRIADAEAALEHVTEVRREIEEASR